MLVPEDVLCSVARLEIDIKRREHKNKNKNEENSVRSDVDLASFGSMISLVRGVYPVGFEYF